MRDKKIFIVDFDTNSLNSLSAFLQEEGFQVIKAKDGQSGLDKFESERPDLIIMEPMIPKLHGFDLCKKIANDSTKEIPVIFTTEFYGEEQCKRETSRHSNLTAFFKKPYRNEDVLSSVFDLLKEKEKKRVSTLKTKQPEKQMKPDDLTQNELLGQEFIPKPELSGKKKKSETPDDINRILQDTLTEFGLDAGKKKAVAPEKLKRAEIEEKKIAEKERVSLEPREMKIREEEEKKEVEIKVEVEKEEEIEKKVLKTKTITEDKEEMEIKEDVKAQDEVKTEAVLDEEELFRRSKSALFTEFPEETKGFSFSMKPLLENMLSKAKSLKKFHIKIPAPRVVLPLAFAALIAGGTAFYFLRPKNVDRFPKGTITSNIPSSQQDSSRLQLAELPSSTLAIEKKSQEDSAPGTAQENKVEKQIQEETTKVEAETQSPPKTEEKPLAKAETAPAQKEASPPPPVVTEPLVSESADFLKIQETPQEESKSSTIQTEEIKPPLSVDNPQQIKKQEESQNMPADTAEKSIKPGDLVALNMVDTPPILLRRVQPKYPPVALNQNIEDKVLINALISEEGEVIETRIIRGEKGVHGFNQASEEALRQWRFRPAIKDGVKVKVWKPILITFKKK